MGARSYQDRPRRHPQPRKEPAIRPSRLDINLGPGVADALADYMDTHDVTATEAIRRAISVALFAEDTAAAGQQLAVIDGRRAWTVHFPAPFEESP